MMFVHSPLQHGDTSAIVVVGSLRVHKRGSSGDGNGGGGRGGGGDGSGQYCTFCVSDACYDRGDVPFFG